MYLLVIPTFLLLKPPTPHRTTLSYRTLYTMADSSRNNLYLANNENRTDGTSYLNSWTSHFMMASEEWRTGRGWKFVRRRREGDDSHGPEPAASGANSLPDCLQKALLRPSGNVISSVVDRRALPCLLCRWGALLIRLVVLWTKTEEEVLLSEMIWCRRLREIMSSCWCHRRIPKLFL